MDNDMASDGAFPEISRQFCFSAPFLPGTGAQLKFSVCIRASSVVGGITWVSSILCRPYSWGRNSVRLASGPQLLTHRLASRTGTCSGWLFPDTPNKVVSVFVSVRTFKWAIVVESQLVPGDSDFARFICGDFQSRICLECDTTVITCNNSSDKVLVRQPGIAVRLSGDRRRLGRIGIGKRCGERSAGIGDL